jgi:hypothetical protein
LDSSSLGLASPVGQCGVPSSYEEGQKKLYRDAVMPAGHLLRQDAESFTAIVGFTAILPRYPIAQVLER